jgi:tyrosine-protein kinase Etk/Wzc
MNEPWQQQPPAQEDDGLDLHQILAVLRNNKLIILFCIIAFSVGGYIYLKGQPYIYQANALIQVEQTQGSGLAGLDEITGAFETESGVAAEIEIIKSRFVLGKVVEAKSLQTHAYPKRLPLAKYAPALNNYLVNQYTRHKDTLQHYNTTDASIQVEQIRMPEELTSVPLTIKITSQQTYGLYDSSNTRLLTGSFGDISFSADGRIMLFLKVANAHPGAEFGLFVNRAVDEINRLRGRLQITEQGRSTGILSIVLEGTGREDIKDTLNKVIQAYQNQNIQRQSEEAQRSIEFLEKQVPEVQRELATAERTVNEYRTQSAQVDLQIETQSALNKIVAIEGKLNELKLQETEISTRYKKDHPIYVTLLKQQGRLLSEQQRINQQIEKLPAKQQELLSLMRNVEVTSAVYLQLLNKMEELKVAKAGTVGNVRILDQAEFMTHPVRPRKNRIMLIALAIGGLLGVGIAFLRIWLNPGLTNPAEVQEKLEITNYGVVPVTRSQRQVEKDTLAPEKKSAVLAATYPKDTALEAIRSIRTSLHFAMLEAKNNLVMLTSPSPDAGKSFISSNLAALLAQGEQKVLLIDMDLRRGHINKAVGVAREPGLSDYLSKHNATNQGIQLTDIIHSKVLPKLDFIATGSIPPNPSELIMSAACTQFMHDIQQAYDIVIIDTPPILAVTDAALIGRHIGTCLMVVRHKRNTLHEIKQCKNELKRLDVPLKGYIYNFAEHESGSRYYYNYYYYDYSRSKKRKSWWEKRVAWFGFSSSKRKSRKKADKGGSCKILSE